MRVPGTEGEASAVVRTGEERMPGRHTVHQNVLGSVEERLALPRDVRMQGLDLLRLLLLDRRLTRRRVRVLCNGGRRGSGRQDDENEQPSYSNAMHMQNKRLGRTP